MIIDRPIDYWLIIDWLFIDWLSIDYWLIDYRLIIDWLFIDCLSINCLKPHITLYVLFASKGSTVHFSKQSHVVPYCPLLGDHGWRVASNCQGLLSEVYRYLYISHILFWFTLLYESIDVGKPIIDRTDLKTEFVVLLSRQ